MWIEKYNNIIIVNIISVRNVYLKIWTNQMNGGGHLGVRNSRKIREVWHGE